jgi:hypothetical protein
MKNLPKFAAWFALSLVLTGVVAWLALSLIFTDFELCANEVSRSIISPSGKIKAVVFSRNCGATTGFNTQVSIIPVSRVLPDQDGNSLILDGAIELKVEWKSDSELHIRGVGSSRVFKQGGSMEGISISYGS